METIRKSRDCGQGICAFCAFLHFHDQVFEISLVGPILYSSYPLTFLCASLIMLQRVFLKAEYAGQASKYF